jgi:phenylpropionate dioxygenase-like ring-hydroxylating dioxygenase large terminal subunit
MFINFWYPICTSDDLPADSPLRSELLGLRFVAFRDAEGLAHVLADTCVHRGGSLSKGKVQDGCIACPYHGWRYDGNGHCVGIPSLRGEKPPARAKVDSYPVQEKYGIVFAFLGDAPEDERPPLYEIGQYDQDGWRKSEVMIVNVPAYYQRSMENGLDPVHNEFVHPLQGAPAVNMDTLESADMPWGSSMYAHMGQPEPGKTRMADLRGDP